VTSAPPFWQEAALRANGVNAFSDLSLAYPNGIHECPLFVFRSTTGWAYAKKWEATTSTKLTGAYSVSVRTVPGTGLGSVGINYIPPFGWAGGVGIIFK
jgi:hypothetical protein